MERVLVSAAVVCLVLSACGGQATPDPTEVAHLVDQAVKATVVAMPTPEPQTIDVEKIVKETVIVEKPVRETVIVEKPVEITVVVEREVIVTLTPTPVPTSTPTPAVGISDLEIVDVEHRIWKTLDQMWKMSVLAVVVNPNPHLWVPESTCVATTFDENDALIGVAKAFFYVGPNAGTTIAFHIEIGDDGVLHRLDIACEPDEWRQASLWPDLALEVVQANYRPGGFLEDNVVGQIRNAGDVEVTPKLLVVLRSADGNLLGFTRKDLWDRLDSGDEAFFEAFVSVASPEDVATVEVHPSVAPFSINNLR